MTLTKRVRPVDAVRQPEYAITSVVHLAILAAATIAQILRPTPTIVALAATSVDQGLVVVMASVHLLAR